MIIQEGVPATFNYGDINSGTGLFVGAKVMDVTAGFPGTQVGALIQLNNNGDGTYSGRFTGVAAKQYQVKKFVYTDGTYATIDTSRAPDVDDYQCEALADLTSVNAVLASLLSALQLAAGGIEGFLDDNDLEITGVLDDSNDIIGVLDC